MCSISMIYWNEKEITDVVGFEDMEKIEGEVLTKRIYSVIIYR